VPGSIEPAASHCLLARSSRLQRAPRWAIARILRGDSESDAAATRHFGRFDGHAAGTRAPLSSALVRASRSFGSRRDWARGPRALAATPVQTRWFCLTASISPSHLDRNARPRHPAWIPAVPCRSFVTAKAERAMICARAPAFFVRRCAGSRLRLRRGARKRTPSSVWLTEGLTALRAGLLRLSCTPRVRCSRASASCGRYILLAVRLRARAGRAGASRAASVFFIRHHWAGPSAPVISWSYGDRSDVPTTVASCPRPRCC